MVGQVVLEGAVVVGLERQLNRLLVGNITCQRFHLDDMGEALKQDGSKCHKDDNELYEEVWFLVHGSESKVNEGVEIGNTQHVHEFAHLTIF